MASIGIVIQPFMLGDWQTNCYVVAPAAITPDQPRPCWFIDAGMNPKPMIEFATRQRLTPTHVVLTHAHLDHIAGLEEICEAYSKIEVLIHEAEAEFLTNAALNLSAGYGIPVVAPEPTGLLAHGQFLELNGVTFEVRHTPGHSPGGISLYQKEANVVFVGDALFAGSVGRVDFPTSDGATLLRSIQTQLLSLPDNTRVYPGHGPATTIGEERRSNPYLRGAMPTH